MLTAPGNIPEAKTPLLQIHVLGEFELTWQVPSFTEVMEWNSRTSARSLLKLLLCAPGRQATRGQLAGILWPESDEQKARESLRSACKVLRRILRTADGEELFEQRSTSDMLKLAEQSRLWVDADAFEELVARASRAATPEEALLSCQQARALLRGELLPEEQNAEWTRHRWVKLRRQALWLARCRMIRHLSDLYVQRGQISLAEEELEQHLMRFPTDQDALYRLLMLLEQQGCFEQACVLYERTRRILDGSGKQVTAHLKVLYERLQQATVSLFPTLPVQSGRSPLEPGSEMVKQPSALAPVIASGILHVGQASLNAGLTRSVSDQVSALVADWSPATIFDSLRCLLALEGTSAMSAMSRRQLLELGIAAIIGRIVLLDRAHISAVERTELGQVLGEMVGAGWKLFHTAGNAEVLAVGRTQLSLLHQAHALVYPSSLPYLYAGTYGLVGIALHLQECNEEALQIYHNGYIAARATGDAVYLARNLICQADTYLALGRYAEALQALEETLSYLGDIDEEHVRLKAHLLGCWADIAMTTREYNLAEKKLDESAAYLDEITLVEEFDRTSWLQLAGKKALMVGNYKQATAYLEEALAANPPQWLVRHAAILIPLAMAYARLRERGRSLLIAQQTVSVLTAIDASMANKQFLEYLQKDILNGFPRDTEIQTFLDHTLQQLPQLAPLVETL